MGDSCSTRVRAAGTRDSKLVRERVESYSERGHFEAVLLPQRKHLPMPMIDVYARNDLFPRGTDHQLAAELTAAVLRAEGVAKPGPFHRENTAAFIHRMDPAAISTAGTSSVRSVRVQVITPPGALSREGQRVLVKEVTEIVAKISGDSTQPQRTWVLLSEAAEGGWGIAGIAYGKEEFAALAARAAAANR